MEQRDWRPTRFVDIHATLGSLQHGAGDPAYHVLGDELWWATGTPHGVGTLRLTASARDGCVHAAAWGEGASWLVDQLPTLLGDDDDPTGFEPHHPEVQRAAGRHGGWRVPKTQRMFDACVAAVIEQKVTGQEARRAWRGLLTKFGEPAPGPVPRPMFSVPSPAVWRRIPDWDLHRASVTPHRIRTLRVVANAAPAMDRMSKDPAADVDRLLRTLPGVGEWTSAETRQRALGDSDAVSFGDFHLAKSLCWWLTGERGDDDRLRELLAPYAGHRYRVQRLMELEGVAAPRRGPRFAAPAHRLA